MDIGRRLNNTSWKRRPPLLECYSLAVANAWG